jgi:type II secretory pathway predicted ATPase ExeA
VETRTGETLTWQQLHYLKNRDKNRLVMNSTSSVVTASDRLIAQLENDPSQSYTALYAQFDSGLLTIKTKKKNQNSAVELRSLLKIWVIKPTIPNPLLKLSVVICEIQEVVKYC